MRDTKVSQLGRFWETYTGAGMLAEVSEATDSDGVQAMLSGVSLIAPMVKIDRVVLVYEGDGPHTPLRTALSYGTLIGHTGLERIRLNWAERTGVMSLFCVELEPIPPGGWKIRGRGYSPIPKEQELLRAVSRWMNSDELVRELDEFLATAHGEESPYA